MNKITQHAMTTSDRDSFLPPLSRRRFLQSGLATGTALSAGYFPQFAAVADDTKKTARAPYEGPNVIIVRFGGGVRRRETIDPEHTFSPYLCRELAKRGTLFNNMWMDGLEDVETSHGQGTLYILTGKYERYEDIEKEFLNERFESQVPTVFEYLRKKFEVPNHQTLIVNGEDRTQEEFYSFSNHHLFGAEFKSEVLSLFRFKLHLLRKNLAEGRFEGKELKEKTKELKKMETLDYRTAGNREPNPEIAAFWNRWRTHWGDSGFINPRGDRLLTELTIWSLRHLKPKLMMVNYNDPDYVHWGNMSHYTRAISIIDQGLRQLMDAVEADEEYRDNTVFVVVPDCGRDSNPFISVPCQHHFNSLWV
jgi:hypothetical protein